MDCKTKHGHSFFNNDNYNSVPLVKNLFDKKTFVTRTLKSNRKGYPNEVVKKLKNCVDQQ